VYCDFCSIDFVAFCKFRSIGFGCSVVALTAVRPVNPAKEFFGFSFSVFVVSPPKPLNGFAAFIGELFVVPPESPEKLLNGLEAGAALILGLITGVAWHGTSLFHISCKLSELQYTSVVRLF